jgi:mono/diheme cytochrome c family protein
MATGSKDKMRLLRAWSIIAGTIFAIVIVLILAALMRFNLTALGPPGSLETRISNRAKLFFIRRAIRQGIPPRPQDTEASVSRGGTHYGLDCSVCHADDGRAERAPGEFMYPRAADLTSKRVQGYSDRELFWIIQNGVRFTGMPAFAKVETPDHIWDLVNYVRTLPSALKKEQSTNSTQQAKPQNRSHDEYQN